MGMSSANGRWGWMEKKKKRKYWVFLVLVLVFFFFFFFSILNLIKLFGNKVKSILSLIYVFIKDISVFLGHEGY